jgi:4-amino-4-deoxy-L-arabinose transferase-like glycosyltransferase
VLAVEREDVILDARIVDRNFLFARTFVESGTFGFVPGVPSAETQPLYGFFLVPVHWLFDGSWLSIGLTQTAVAIATAWLVFEIGRRLLAPRWAAAAAVVATLNPYLVWHDVHVGREVLDGLLAAAATLLALVVAGRRSLAAAAALGAVAGLAVLANVRLVFLPLVLAGFLFWQLPRWRRASVTALVVVVASALTVAPWVVRNQVRVGCYALTTNALALWKANNSATYEVLDRGGWIDDVPITVAPPADVARDECARMRFYERRVLEFWRDNPGEKARLAGQATLMLWDPRARTYEVRSRTGEEIRPVSGRFDFARTWGQGAYMAVLYVLAPLGLLGVRRAYAVLSVALLAYVTLMAMVFAGTTRYRVSWDFLLALLAAVAVTVLARSDHRR